MRLSLRGMVAWGHGGLGVGGLDMVGWGGLGLVGWDLIGYKLVVDWLDCLDGG